MKLKYKIIILASCFLVLTLAIVATIILVSREKKEVLICATTYNSYVYTQSKNLSFSLWTNIDDSPLSDISSYSSLSISNSDNSKLLSLDIFKISKITKEYYLNEDFNKLILYAPMPNLGGDFAIDNYNLNIYLTNNKEYHLNMGSISLMYLNDVGSETAYKLDNLYGAKDETKVLSRLKFIYLEGYLESGINITNISLGLLINCSYTIESNKIIISIDWDPLILYNTPVIIYYNQNLESHTQIIDNFIYFEDVNFLASNGPLLNFY